ncbi:MlaD family protein [Flocculibacter collagenilyticus]|uniref:MlaD family protein n=1 Tax=Flocculibacter collagenilyticus TaxID=2744479 RepID=UPI0018F544B3|nr:MlaD family protein [Flocculibacter collagenilyticus]
MTNKAKVKSSNSHHWQWLIPIFAIALTSFIVWRNLPPEGEMITLIVNDADGIKKGQTRVRYMGVDIGDIEEITLSDDVKQVNVSLKVDKKVLPLIRDNTQFWVVRPEISASGLKGIKTLVSGPYITFKAGEGEAKRQFIALEKPPIIKKEGVKIKLISNQLHNISPGDDIFYKQVPVGKIYAYQLTSQNVILYAQVHEPYNQLLRENSVFWEQSGLEFDMSLLGVSMSANPMVSLLSGGVSFATPNEPGAIVKEGTQFILAEDREDKWQSWQPNITFPSRIITQEGESHEEDNIVSSAADQSL